MNARNHKPLIEKPKNIKTEQKKLSYKIAEKLQPMYGRPVQPFSHRGPIL